MRKRFDTVRTTLSKGDVIYLSSDGYVDQFGGPSEKKYMKKRFEPLLRSVMKWPLAKQLKKLEQELDAWKGHLPQVDDILVAGLKY